MRSTWVSLILGILLTACGKQYQDPAFTSIVNDFVADAANRGIRIQVNSEIKFGDSATESGSADTVGFCTHNASNISNDGTIVIDQNHWNQIGQDEQKFLLYHELGHCILGRAHVASESQVLVSGSSGYCTHDNKRSN